MPDAYNPWGAPVFPTAADNAMQPETFVPQGVQDWTRQAAPKDYNILSQIAGSLGKALMYPGQVAQSQTPISTEDMVGPAFNLAGMLTLGAGAAPQEANALNMGIKAYHSSPHDFNAFSMDKIGTGEGAQAYGHGLYFAENPSVSGQGGDYWRQFARQMNSGDTPEAQAVRMLEATDGDRAAAIARGEAALASGNYQIKNLPDAVSLLKSDKLVGPRTYEVNINADPSHFLDWDKPLSQQHPVVQQAIAERGLAPKEVDLGSFGGQPIVGAPRWAGTAEESAKLREAGIPGIKYLDQGSRGAGEGSSNYVVFNHDLIDIMRKYAVPGMLGAPILANALREQKT